MAGSARIKEMRRAVMSSERMRAVMNPERLRAAMNEDRMRTAVKSAKLAAVAFVLTMIYRCVRGVMSP